ncbi:MAG TPA: response regulator transcription factor [Candidatus Cybelea sp.]|nr:response regulator transcription factor [Candidatus Cybelea sp.]
MHIVVADSQPIFRQALCDLLHRVADDAVIVETSDWNETAQRVANGDAADFLLFDTALAEGPLIDACARLHRAQPNLRIVLLSARFESGIYRAFAATGAASYITKTSAPNLIASALRVVVNGGIYLPAEVLEVTRPRSDGAEVPPHVPGPAPMDRSRSALSPRQQEVLSLLRQGRSNKEIAEALGLAEGTVKVHVNGVLRKLGARNRAQAVLRASEL